MEPGSTPRDSTEMTSPLHSGAPEGDRTGIPLRVPGSPKLLFRIDVAVAVVLGAIYLAYQSVRFGLHVTPPHDLVEIFDLDSEATLPAWYSGAQLLVIAFRVFYARLGVT